jgi:hypothetical protein
MSSNHSSVFDAGSKLVSPKERAIAEIDRDFIRTSSWQYRMFKKMTSHSALQRLGLFPVYYRHTCR